MHSGVIYRDDARDVPSVPVLVHEMDRDARGRAVYEECSLTQCDGAVLGTEGLEYKYPRCRHDITAMRGAQKSRVSSRC